MKTVLGIDTSCYTSSIAIWEEQLGIVHAERKILEVPNGQRGLRQSDGVFQHMQNIPALIQNIPQPYIEALQRIVVSSKPRNQEGSYMPVFTSGMQFADVISKVKNIDVTYTDHQSNHCFAALIDYPSLLNQDFLALHLSGGTTEIIHVRSTLDSTDNFCGLSERIVGETLDLSFGQVVDRIGVAAGLKFPAGREMELISQSASVTGPLLSFPHSLKGNHLNLSGMETYGLNYIQQGQSHDLVFHSLFTSIGELLSKLIILSAETTTVRNVLCVGGVTSNNTVRRVLGDRIKTYNATHDRICCFFAKPDFATDHSVGCAYLGSILEGWA